MDKYFIWNHEVFEEIHYYLWISFIFVGEHSLLENKQHKEDL